MMKMNKGKKGRTASKVDYDTRESKTENIYTINFDTDSITDIKVLRQIISDNIAVEVSRKDGNEYIAFVIAPPVSRELVDACIDRNYVAEANEREKMKIKSVELASEFVTENFALNKSVIIVHEKQSLPHAHILLCPNDMTGEKTRIDSLKELQKSYAKLERKYFSEELDYLQERKDNCEVLDAEFQREKYSAEKRQGKRESFDELIKKIESNRINEKYAIETIDEMYTDDYKKEVLKERVYEASAWEKKIAENMRNQKNNSGKHELP